MYKVIFNNNEIILSNQKKIDTNNFYYNSNNVFDYIINLINKNQLYKSKDFNKFIIYHPNLKFLWNSFCNYFIQILAAGGIVKNYENKLLIIYRHGKLDLPKGKVENGEKFAQTAIREVQEECGIKELKLIRFFRTTYHIYNLNSKYYLKSSHWYLMYSKKNENLIPEINEGINAVDWKSKKDIFQSISKFYKNIKNLLLEYYSIIE